MNINFELYRIFYEVANVGNITKAAGNLCISQPAISKAIKNLEEQLGGTLFVRTPRGVILTEEGKEFYKYIKAGIEQFYNAEHKFNELIQLGTGTIRIGISRTMTKEVLLPYLQEFHKTYPLVNIQINTSIGKVLIEKLRNGQLDLLILNLPLSTPKDINVKKIKEIHDCLIVSEKYKKLTDKVFLLKELDKYPLILQERSSNTREFFENFCDKNKIKLKPNMSLASYSLVVEFTKLGLGIGYATYEYIERDIADGALYKLKTEPKIPSRFIGLATSKNHLPSFSAKKLIELIKKDT